MTKAPAKRPPVAGHVLLGLGLTSVVIGLAFKQIIPDQAFWSDQQATEYTEAYRAAHAASSGHDHSHAGGHSHDVAEHSGQPNELAAARQRFEAAHENLVQARTTRNYMGHLLAVGGAIFACVGLAMIRLAEDS